MPNTLTNTKTGFTRCAVCKIDLKGRFVFVDSLVEQLLDYSQEELIGKSFLDFTDESSHEFIEQLLTFRNHYETFYDTAIITIINRDKQKITTRLIASLSFISGNPVNYQMILDPFTQLDKVIVLPSKKDQYQTFIEKIAQLESCASIDQYLPVIRQFSEAKMVCLYRYDNNQFDLISTAPFISVKDMNYSQALKTGRLYYDIFENNSYYSYIEKEKVKEAIEKYGNAPNEYAVSIILQNNSKYLLRFIFDSSTDHRKAVRSIKNIQDSLNLIKRLIFEEDEKIRPITFQFTIGLLELLGICAFLTDESGNIVGYNNHMIELIGEKNLEGNYLSLLNKLTTDNSILLKVIEYVTSSLNNDIESYIAEEIQLPNNKSVDLNVVKLSDKTLDLTCLFIIGSKFHDII